MPKNTSKSQPALSDAELEAMDVSAQLAMLLRKIIGNDSSNAHYDWLEVTTHIHALQNMILSQAAARAYPGKYRLLGQKLDDPSTTDDTKS